MNGVCYLRKCHNLRSLPATKLTASCLFSSSSVADESWVSVPGNPLIKWPQPSNGLPWAPPPPPPAAPLTSPEQSLSSNPSPSYQKHDFTTLCSLLKDPSLLAGPTLESALDSTGIEPASALLEAVFDYFDSSPKSLHTLFQWALKQPGFQSSPALFNLMINLLGKMREFDSAWSLVLDRIGTNEGLELVSCDTFVIMIRRYSRAGMTQPAIRTFEYASTLDLIRNSDSVTNLLEILLDSLCKEGHVRVASEYFDRKKELDPNWVPTIRVYNILLNGWFRSRKLKHAEGLWKDMRNKNVTPNVVTYGTIVEGYCRMRRVDKAMSLVHEMRREGIEPNAIVYNPIIDALGESGRFKEVSWMMERLSVCVSGPTISTYNSLVKGYCKAGDLVGASKILKTMISRSLIPTPTTYNYFFRYFSKFRKIEEGMNLYTKMIKSGHGPDRLTYHLLVKMLCEEQRLDLAVQVSVEMRSRGYDMDLATGTMLIHLLCRMHKLKEAFAEFEDMLRRGIVPQYLTFQLLNNELKQQGMNDMAHKLCGLMSSVPHPTNLPNTYRANGDPSRTRRSSIMRKAEAMSDILKTCRDPRQLVKHTRLSENLVSSANRLIENIKKRVKET
ncbi:hypothetical protein HS088_TW09G01348 [Tripterygium wilfordii]|uniref:Pentatricopeptide repeat-containing protein n=1 Tax=Tripterygium wilfordii TaxID=458696 RepID=A0A7J7DAA5_TRIWF|nr:pentatricopeptide repeat-containing protein At5g11310, mitochondrial [Tripterygium wilfordii]KAF5743282.1 hypothetical protein HS088_TW09G01348 [Tripterygium wilfordii]